MRSAVFILLAAVVPMTRAQTIWNGPTTNFTPSGVYSAATPGTYDLLTADVALARNGDYPLFNSQMETSYDASAGSPKNTTWALGSLTNLDTLIADDAFETWATVIGGGGDGSNLFNYLPGKTYVVHLVSDNIYLQLTFDTWNSANQQGSSLYSYTRTTPAAVAPTPTVSITSPASNAVFAAPANIRITASALVSSGTVTNVTFFKGATSLGSATTSPFGITASNLAANPYSLTAVAMAAGVSATSAVVNISVVSPVAVSNSLPAITAGHFSLDYTVNPGLAYVIESSSDLDHWVSIATNVASNNPAVFTDSSGLSSQRFYRIVRQPNP
jgi:hypothetical protein